MSQTTVYIYIYPTGASPWCRLRTSSARTGSSTAATITSGASCVLLCRMCVGKQRARPCLRLSRRLCVHNTHVCPPKLTNRPKPKPTKYNTNSYDYEGVEKAGAEAMFAAMVRACVPIPHIHTFMHACMHAYIHSPTTKPNHRHRSRASPPRPARPWTGTPSRWRTSSSTSTPWTALSPATRVSACGMGFCVVLMCVWVFVRM